MFNEIKAEFTKYALKIKPENPSKYPSEKPNIYFPPSLLSTKANKKILKHCGDQLFNF